MAQIINTNLASLNAQRNVNASQSSLSTAMQRLSSGLRVNSAKDDASGLAIADRMNAQVRGMNVAMRNANDGISMAQTLEGALGKVTDSLQRMRELAVQSSNDTNNTTDRASLDEEFQQLALEVTRVLGGTKFNNQALLGDDAGAKVFQVGANTETEDSITVTTTDLTGDADITAVTQADVASQANASAAIALIDTAIDTVNTERATLGAVQNRFDSVISNLQVSSENQAAARSRIMDADFAAETANLSRASILQQAGNAMLAQANQLPQQVLSLLK